ncbi:MAG: hypothetical protein ACJ8CR_30645 [Roseiflexaceae bacterium]
MKTRGRSRIGAAAIAAGVLVLVSASAASAHHILYRLIVLG